MSASSDKFLQVTLENGLEQMVDKPTRGKYINDLVLCGNTSLVQDVTVNNRILKSDHKSISVIVHIPVQRTNHYPRKTYLYSKGRYTIFDKEASELDWELKLGNGKNIEQKWSIFKHTYFDLLDKHVPSKLLKPGNKPKVPWLKSRKLSSIRKRAKKARKMAGKTDLYTHGELVSDLESEYNLKVAECQKEYESIIVAETLQDLVQILIV